MSCVLHHGDCRELLVTLPDCSVDAVVTDPPYGLEFMGKDWDAPWQASSKSALFGKRDTTMPGFGSQRNATCLTCKGRLRGKTRCECEEPRWDEAPSATNNRQMLGFQDWFYDIAVECLRVLKPGGHLLAFGGTRTYHRMAVAIEDAGFEIRDSIHWIYGSGFPKSLDVSKAIDKAAGVEREVVGSVDVGPDIRGGNYENALGRMIADITTPATDAARQWAGWGTALKPAHEPIVVARKPLAGTVAGNVLAHGTGALNIDGCRVGYASDGDKAQALAGDAFRRKDTSDKGWSRPWVDDPDRVARMNAEAKVRAQAGRWPANVILDDTVADAHPDWARYFYCAKPSKAERTCGGTVANGHPTLKPLTLMRYLVRLVTPPNGTVLDPFAGSGTTLMAAVLEGFNSIGIEMTDDYLPIILGRVAWAESQPKPEPGPIQEELF